MCYVMIYLSVGLTPGGSSTVHIYTQTIHRTTQITSNLEECGPCPVFASCNLGICLTPEEKHGKNSVRVAEEYPHITKPTHINTPTHYKTHTYKHTHTLQNPHIHTHPHITKPTHTHTLQNPHI